MAALADRPAGYRPARAPASTNLLRLPEIIAEIMSVGSHSKRVSAEVGRLVAALGPELDILTGVPYEEITRAGGGLLGEAVARLRRGEVIREAGFDGEYGTIRLMRPDELQATGTLFDLPAPSQRNEDAAERLAPVRSAVTAATGGERARTPGENGDQAVSAAAGRVTHETGGRAAGLGPRGTRRGRAAQAASTLLDGLDPQQRAAVTAPGPVLIVAGPGTGKTRTLTHRIAYQISQRRVQADQCLALTFTRRAAEEMRQRLAALAGLRSREITVTTFHGLGLQILRQNHAAAGLDPDFRVADEAATLAVAAELAGIRRGRASAARARGR